jgi:hypothetical protein
MLKIDSPTAIGASRSFLSRAWNLVKPLGTTTHLMVLSCVLPVVTFIGALIYPFGQRKPGGSMSYCRKLLFRTYDIKRRLEGEINDLKVESARLKHYDEAQRKLAEGKVNSLSLTTRGLLVFLLQ